MNYAGHATIPVNQLYYAGYPPYYFAQCPSYHYPSYSYATVLASYPPTHTMCNYTLCANPNCPTRQAIVRGRIVPVTRGGTDLGWLTADQMLNLLPMLVGCSGEDKCILTQCKKKKCCCKKTKEIIGRMRREQADELAMAPI
jgi:hypothetical protein